MPKVYSMFTIKIYRRKRCHHMYSERWNEKLLNYTAQECRKQMKMVSNLPWTWITPMRERWCFKTTFPWKTVCRGLSITAVFKIQRMASAATAAEHEDTAAGKKCVIRTHISHCPQLLGQISAMNGHAGGSQAPRLNLSTHSTQESIHIHTGHGDPSWRGQCGRGRSPTPTDNSLLSAAREHVLLEHERQSPAPPAWECE